MIIPVESSDLKNIFDYNEEVINSLISYVLKYHFDLKYFSNLVCARKMIQGLRKKYLPEVPNESP
jgi:hypothetical protein